MAAFDEILEGPAQDKIQQWVEKYDATMAALKTGTSLQVWAGNGATSAPAPKDIWETYIVVGSGGSAPAYSSNFIASGGGSNTLRFRRSLILNTIEITGRFERTTSTIVDNAAATVFILPSGYRPTRVPNTSVRNGLNFRLLGGVIDPSNGEFFITNGTETTMTVGTYFDVTFRFPIS